MYVRDLMTREVVTCKSDSNAETAALMMWNSDCGSVPVVDNSGRAIGMITDRDICMAVALQRKSASEIQVKDFMSNQLYSCHPEDNIRHAMKTMASHKIKRLPITNGSGQVEGLLSIDDIVACAERGARGISTPELSFDDTMVTLKAVCNHHH